MSSENGDERLSGSITRSLEFEAQRLEEMAGPALILDVRGARLLAANRAARTALGIQALASSGLVLDRATPALATLADKAAAPPPHELVFWTGGASRVLKLFTDALPSLGPGVVRLCAPERTAAQPDAGTGRLDGHQTDDVQTMSAIARRIREGLGGALVPADPRPNALRAAAQPQAIQSHSISVPAGAVGPVDVAATADATAEWPGLRVVSERDIATLAHELRTPLSAIMSLAEVMRDERLGPTGNPRYIEYAADIYNSADHALKVLRAMVEGEALSPYVGRTDANAVIMACVSALGPLAARAEVKLIPSLAAGLPAILADARTLKQILLNLLSNALQHTPPGGEITLTTAYRVDGPVRIEVRDTGRGITDDDLRQIEAEIEADRNGLPPPAGEGGGLGLPLVCRLAGANGAEFGIDSKPGRGTRVFLTFSRDRVAQDPV